MNAKLAKYALPGVTLLVLVGTAAAAISLTYTATSSQSLGVKAAPVTFSAGADGGVSDYVPSLSLSTNKTSFTATLKGVPEATVTLGDLVDLSNVDSRAHSVTITAPQNSNSFVTAYKVDWYDGATLVGTLDFKAASPSVSFASMVAGKVYAAKVTITLAAGAGANNVNDPAMALTTAVSS